MDKRHPHLDEQKIAIQEAVRRGLEHFRPPDPDQAADDAEKPVEQRRPDLTGAAFGRRLNAGLDALDVAEAERPAKVSEAAGVTIRTARRYLSGTSQPRSALHQAELADALGIARAWLLFGQHGPKTTAEAEQAQRFIEAYQGSPPWRQRLIQRTVTRMANQSPRVERLRRMHEAGQIGADQFLELAGK